MIHLSGRQLRRIRSTAGLLSMAMAFALVTNCSHDTQPGQPSVEGRDRRGPVDTWPPRALWMPRKVYDSPREIASRMEWCRQAGFNTVLFQVRGNGTAWYPSKIEPLAYEYGGDPGFDPLAVACREAHKRGLTIQAWVNVCPGWKGTRPPNDPDQLYNAHPEWFWYDQRGKRQPLSTFYVSLNPCLPEVRAYLVDVCEEIVRNYSVDGLHLDYIRFPVDKSPRGSDYPYDKKTLKLYRSDTGKRPSQDKAAWKRWRTDQVTELVREIRSMMRRKRPHTTLTAACSSRLSDARNHYFQDGPSWLRMGLVDQIFVMNYTADMNRFVERQREWRRASGDGPLAPGIGAYLHKTDDITIRQMNAAWQWGDGFALFSSNSLFDGSSRSNRRLDAVDDVLHAMRRESIGRQDARRASGPNRGIDVDLSATYAVQGATVR